MTGLVQRYAARPTSLNSVCLADFAVDYDVCYRNTQWQRDDNDNDILSSQRSTVRDTSAIITLNDGLGKMRRRKTRAILMTHRFSQEKEPEKYYHSELMLYTPWRDEDRDLLGAFETYSESYVEHSDEIIATKNRLYHHSESLADAVDELLQNGPPLNAWDDLAPQTRQEETECADEGTLPQTFIDCAEDQILHTTFVDTTAAAAAAPTSTVSIEAIPAMSDSQFLELTRSLNPRQQQLFQFILDWCRARQHCQKTRPFHVFCTGGAGVGKSHLISAVVQMANRELRQPGDSPDDTIVLLTAPTGTAVYNISGSTLHSAFFLGVTGSSRSDVLSADRLATLRNKYSKLRLLVIDEVQYAAEIFLDYKLILKFICKFT